MSSSLSSYSGCLNGPANALVRQIEIFATPCPRGFTYASIIGAVTIEHIDFSILSRLIQCCASCDHEFDLNPLPSSSSWISNCNGDALTSFSDIGASCLVTYQHEVLPKVIACSAACTTGANCCATTKAFADLFSTRQIFNSGFETGKWIVLQPTVAPILEIISVQDVTTVFAFNAHWDLQSQVRQTILNQDTTIILSSTDPATIIYFSLQPRGDSTLYPDDSNGVHHFESRLFVWNSISACSASDACFQSLTSISSPTSTAEILTNCLLSDDNYCIYSGSFVIPAGYKVHVAARTPFQIWS